MTDKNELATRAGTAIAAAGDLTPAEKMFAGLMEIIKDPSVSPEKMSAMLDLQERMINRQSLMDFNAAKLAAVQEMPFIDKDGKIKNKSGDVQSRFATFEAIDKIVRPICAKYGLVYSFNLQAGNNGATLVTCEVAHIGGHVEKYGPLSVPLDTSGNKNPTQGVGSSSSYGKRYTLCAAFNIVTIAEDNDGQTATKMRGSIENADWGDELLHQARLAASGGTASYGDFFAKLSPIRKGWLVELGHHEELKTSASEIDAATQ